MQSNSLFHFCCWLNVNEHLHSLWLEENLGLLWFSFSSSRGLLFTWPIFQSHCSFTQGENSSITVMSLSEIYSHFQAALTGIADSDYFLLSPGYKENCTTVQHRPLPVTFTGPSASLKQVTVLKAGRCSSHCCRKAFFVAICTPELLFSRWSFAVTENRTLGIGSCQYSASLYFSLPSST